MPLNDAEIALKWEDEAQLLPFTAADRVQAAAQTWNGYISALLGVVGLAGVTFVPQSIENVAGSSRPLVLALGMAVILLGLLAVVCSALASGVSVKSVWNDGTQYKAAVKRRAENGARLLNASRWLTFLALTFLLLAAAVATFHQAIPKPLPLAIAFQAGGPALCGVPTTGKGGVVSLKVNGTVQPLLGLSALTPVETCPGLAP